MHVNIILKLKSILYPFVFFEKVEEFAFDDAIVFRFDLVHLYSVYLMTSYLPDVWWYLLLNLLIVKMKGELVPLNRS